MFGIEVGSLLSLAGGGGVVPFLPLLDARKRVKTQRSVLALRLFLFRFGNHAWEMQVTYFGVVTPFSSISCASANFLLCILLHREDGDDLFLRTTWRYNPEVCTRHYHCRKNVKSNFEETFGAQLWMCRHSLLHRHTGRRPSDCPPPGEVPWHL